MAKLSKRFFLSRCMLPALAVLFLTAPRAEEFRIPDDYDTIAEALRVLKALGRTGDTLLVEPGTYTVNSIIDFPVTIRGEETAATILEGDSGAGPIFQIGLTNDVTVKNFYFGEADSGIRVSGSTSVSLLNNVFNLGSTVTAIEVLDGSTVSVKNNTFYDNRVGVSRTSADTTLVNNAFVKQRTAISSENVTEGVRFNGFYDNDLDGLRGINAVTASDPLFVSTAIGDFHLRQTSPFIDEGDGTDVSDDSTADIGAYGGEDADVRPFQVHGISAADATAAAGTASFDVTWTADLSYLVTHTSDPGSYKLHYDSDGSGAPYDGVDGGGGNLPSPVSVGSVSQFRLENLSPSQELPTAPIIQEVTPGDGTLALAWPAVAHGTGYYVYYGIVDVTENRIDVGSTTSHTLTGLTNGQAYKVAVSAWYQARYYVNVTAVDSTGENDRESRLGTEAVVAVGEIFEGARSAEVAAIPELPQPFPDLPNEGCFVATAAFGGVDAPAVALLRQFRDRYLKLTVAGKVLVRAYYRYSPRLAAVIKNSPPLRRVTQVVLTPLVAVAAAMTRFPEYVAVVFLLFGMRRLIARRSRWR